jgi:RNA polymerase sigma-70 factor (ECF subfamily)
MQWHLGQIFAQVWVFEKVRNIHLAPFTRVGFWEEVMSEVSRDDRLAKELVAIAPAIRSFGRRFLSNPADLDDLVQEVLMKALANLDKFQDGTNLRPWVFTITRNVFCNGYRLRKRIVYGLHDKSAGRFHTDPSQEWALHLDDLKRAIARLPVPQRDALELVAFQGNTYEHAAASCGCAVGTIKSRVNRARHMLAYALGSQTMQFAS